MNRHLYFFFFYLCVISALALLPGCRAMDAAWETIDPMGHRSEHQMRYYPRGKNTGIKLPDNDDS